MTPTASEGAWVNCDKVRFRLGYPEKIGGWKQYNSNSYLGDAINLHQWNDLNVDRYMAVATNLKLYIEFSGGLSDVTPIRRTVTLGTNPILPTGGGSTLVTITDVGHGAGEGDFVTLSGATAGQLTTGQINVELQIVSVIDVNTYRVNPGVVVSGAGVAFGGAAVQGVYQANTGINSQFLGSGAGSGPAGRGPAGSGYFNSTFLFRTWTTDNYGEDLLALPNYSQIYIWKPGSGLNTRAIPIASQAGANLVPTTALLMLVTDERHVVCFGCNEFNSSILDPMLVRWSSQENYLDWEPRTDNTSGSQRLPTGSNIVAAIKSKGETLIWTDKGVHSMQFVGPPYTFGFTLVSNALSIVGPYAAINARNSVYWMDENQFFLYNGTVLPLECTVREYVFGDFNFSQRYKVFALLVSEFNEIWWLYPSANSNSCDRYVSYNFLNNEWFIGTLQRTAGLDLALGGKPVMAFDGNLYQHESGVDDGLDPMMPFIESGDLDIGDGEQFSFIRRIIPDMEWFDSSNPTARYIIKARDFPGGNLITRADRSVTDGTDEYGVRVRARQIVLRIESNGLGTNWRAGVTRLDLQPDGRR